jgi:hypothetical protein
MFADNFLRGAIATMEVGAQAYRIAKAEGLTGKEMSSRIAELVNTPGSQAWQMATDKATDAAFMTPLRTKDEGGTRAENAVAHITKLRNAVKLLGLVIPFIRTPFNIFRMGIRKSPLGAINFAWSFAEKGLFKREKGQSVIEAYPELIRDTAEQVIAWAGAILLHSAVEGDEDDDDKFFSITGSRPSRRGEGAVRRRATGGDYMIRIGGVTIPYGRIEPMATILGTTADLIRVTKSEGTDARALEQLYGWMLSQTTNKTFLRGIGDIFKAAETPERMGGHIKKQILQGLVPNLIRQPLRNSDDYYREWATKKWWYDIFPHPSGAEIKIDPSTGKEMKKVGTAASRFLIPSSLETEKLSRVDRFLVNWNRENPSQSWGPLPPDRTLNLGKDKGKVDLGPNSYKYLAKRSATLAQKELAVELSPFKIDRPKEDTLNRIRKAYTDGRAQARDELRRRPPSKLNK